MSGCDSSREGRDEAAHGVAGRDFGARLRRCAVGAACDAMRRCSAVPGAVRRRAGLRGRISVPGCGVVRVGGVRWVRRAMPCGGAVRFRTRCAAARFRHGAGSRRLPARHEGRMWREGGAWMVGDRHFRYNAPRAEILLQRAGLCAVRARWIVGTDTWWGGCRSAGPLRGLCERGGGAVGGAGGAERAGRVSGGGRGAGRGGGASAWRGGGGPPAGRRRAGAGCRRRG